MAGKTGFEAAAVLPFQKQKESAVMLAIGTSAVQIDFPEAAAVFGPMSQRGGNDSRARQVVVVVGRVLALDLNPEVDGDLFGAEETKLFSSARWPWFRADYAR